MTDKVYLIVTRKWTSNVPDKLDSCTIGNEVFENRNDARHVVKHDKDFVGSRGWVEDEDGNETVEIRFQSNTDTGEPCERIVRWEICSLPIRPRR